jgi:hypothetical protein
MKQINSQPNSLKMYLSPFKQQIFFRLASFAVSSLSRTPYLQVWCADDLVYRCVVLTCWWCCRMNCVCMVMCALTSRRFCVVWCAVGRFREAFTWGSSVVLWETNSHGNLAAVSKANEILNSSVVSTKSPHDSKHKNRQVVVVKLFDKK